MTTEQRQQAEEWLRGWTGVKGCYGHCRSHMPNSDWSCAWCTFWMLLTDINGPSLPMPTKADSRPASPVAPHAHPE